MVSTGKTKSTAAAFKTQAANAHAQDVHTKDIQVKKAATDKAVTRKIKTSQTRTNKNGTTQSGKTKTQATTASVRDFLAAIAEPARRHDCETVLQLMQAATKAEPVMWGSSIVGFGTYRYRYASGREGDWPLVGFSPRKTDLTLYIMPGFERFDFLMSRLGKYKTGKSCLYLKKLEDVDLTVLKQLIVESVAYMKARPVR